MKHRFPSAKFFRRGQEFYGQQVGRLDEPGYRETIAEIGILVVEGMNDVIRLDAEGVPAVALMSNEITGEQVEKVVRWARRLAGGKVSLMLDNDDRGREGAESALWKLARQTPVLVADYPTAQPEHLSSVEMETAYRALFERWQTPFPS